MAADADEQVTPRRGRSPALAPDAERRALLDATLRVLRRSGYDRATLDEVLGEAGLSTRAFYRHYGSKEELLVALHREEATAFAARLERLVAASDGPLDALRAWLDDILALGYEPRRAARAGLLRSNGARDAAGWEDARQAALHALTTPLVAVLEAGLADGTFPTTEPVADARTIYRMAFGLLEGVREQTPALTREEAAAHVLRFALPALGATPAKA